MAKMKVHELAKELEIQSKDVISYLQGKGYEVKAAQSSIDDEEIGLVKKEFGMKAAETAASAKEEVKAEPAAKAEETKPEAGEHPKKKKSIIIIGNPHNSKMPAGQRTSIPQQRPQGSKTQGGRLVQGQNNARPAQGAGRPVQGQTAGRPAQSTIAAKPQQAQQNTAAAEKPAEAVKTQSAQTQAPVQKAPYVPQQPGRMASNRPSETQNNNGRNDNNRNDNNRNDSNRNDGNRNDSRNDSNRNDRRNDNRNGSRGDFAGRNQNGARANGQRNSEGGSRPYRGNGQNDRPGNNGGSGGNRNGSGNGRSERRDDRPGNQFRKQTGGKGFVPESPIKDTEKHRDEEKRRIAQEKDKRSKKDHIYEEDESKLKSKGNKAGRFIKPEKKVEEKAEEQIKVITIPDSITIKELAEKMKMQPAAIVKKLFLQGQIVTVNQEVDFETAENIAIDFDIICEKEIKVDVIEELLREEEEQEEDLVKRAPVICVMGHVDHGKTSLLDAIRKTNVTDREAGGITQHIGAYTVNIDGQSITFLDTPGHEAFTAMRMRGANSTDIAILVVAADDGVMPQTVEAINHAKAAGIEIIVAVNKMDKPSANIDRVKQELAEHELISVDWGGTTEFVPVSAKSGEGINTLLETIILTSEILELKANPNRNARGLVIEAELDKGRGPVATVLVQKGTLHVGDFVSAGASHGKVRAMVDDKGRRVKEAGPSTPVEILGLSDVPNAGEVIIAHESDKVAKSFAETYLAQHKEKMLEETKAKMSLDDLFSQIKEGNLKELNLIIKADVQGSVEAVKQSLMKLSNEEVIVKCIHGGVGAINESDVSLASASNAIIIGFNVRPDATAKAIAEREGVDVRLYKVIYQAIEDVEAAMKGMLDPVFEEKIIGHAEVRQIFKASAIGNIAGSYVLDGEFQRGCKVRISREGKQIYEGNLASLKRFKDDVKEVKAGFECGLVFEGFDQMQELDIVEAYIMVEVPR